MSKETDSQIEQLKYREKLREGYREMKELWQETYDSLKEVRDDLLNTSKKLKEANSLIEAKEKIIKMQNEAIEMLKNRKQNRFLNIIKRLFNKKIKAE